METKFKIAGVISILLAVVFIIYLGMLAVIADLQRDKECRIALQPDVHLFCEELGYDTGELFTSLSSARIICKRYLHVSDIVTVEEIHYFRVEYTCDPPNLTSVRVID